jgi:methenyltetrahydromethanopterin cyclohydrolase
LSLNQQAAEICQQAIRDQRRLRIGSDQRHAKLLDFGVEEAGGLAAGIVLARICTSGLADISLSDPHAELPFPTVNIYTDHPIAACMASQYAGWPVQSGDFFSMGSGPARSLRGKEELLEKLAIHESSETAVVVLETSKLPVESICKSIADDCQVAVENLFVACAPTRSIAGSLQVVSRSIETALHKLFTLGFDLQQVSSGFGSAPLPPGGKKDLDSIGRTNDAILYGANVVLWVDCDPAEIERVGEQLPSSSSDDYGEPFAVIFKRYNYDFYKIDPLLFSPARVTLVNARDGKAHSFGEVQFDLLVKTFVS